MPAFSQSIRRKEETSEEEELKKEAGRNRIGVTALSRYNGAINTQCQKPCVPLSLGMMLSHMIRLLLQSTIVALYAPQSSSSTHAKLQFNSPVQLMSNHYLQSIISIEFPSIVIHCSFAISLSMRKKYTSTQSTFEKSITDPSVQISIMQPITETSAQLKLKLKK